MLKPVISIVVMGGRGCRGGGGEINLCGGTGGCMMGGEPFSMASDGQTNCEGIAGVSIGLEIRFETVNRVPSYLSLYLSTYVPIYLSIY
jgi:hypothetical protein